MIRTHKKRREKNEALLMGMIVSAASAAILTSRSERTIRRMITDGRLRASEGTGPRKRNTKNRTGPSAWIIDTDDLIVAGLAIDSERLYTLQAQEGRTPGGMLARITHLENEHRTVLARLASIERAIRSLTRQDGQEDALPAETVRNASNAPYVAPVLPEITPRAHIGAYRDLPDGWVSLNSFCTERGYNTNTVKGMIRRGVASCQRGAWIDGQARIFYALDLDQQRRITELFSPGSA